jgi:ABC-type transport system involved in multi-copper enzyme maturation permease subunit
MNKASRVLSLTYFILLSFIAMIASIKFDVGFFKIPPCWNGDIQLPSFGTSNTYIAAILKLFLAIVIVSMMANEYSYGTLKQNLIDGLSKKEFILSKFLTVILFSSVLPFSFVMSLILGFVFLLIQSYPSSFLNGIFSGVLCQISWLFSFCLF